ncbi:PAS domain S-box-containing protein [Paenibacillus mucilaginosus]|uniref:hybrid sensor histidine kinase/response regulator n=1 Tax=Paenibacillus mucilaginosus TaxID=61624 RepID=UPI003D210527
MTQLNDIHFLGDITIFLSAEGVIRNINKSIFNIVQYTEEQLIGSPVNRLLPAYDLQWLSEGDYQPYRDTELVTQNGERLPVAVSASALRDDNHKLIGVWILLGDARESGDRVPLRDLEHRYRALTEHALDAVIVMNADGRIIEWNQRAEIEFGWLEKEAVGEELAELIIPPSYREQHKRGLARFTSTGEGRILNKRLELTALHRNGYEFPIELTVTPVKWGKSHLFSAFVRNITGRKQAEEELIQAKERAEAGAKAKSEFLATMSHEIRTPLNGITGMTSLLMETDLTPEQQECVDYLVKSQKALLSVITDVLDYSKIDSGNIQLDVEPFDLSVCLEETIDLFYSEARVKDLKLSCHLDPQIPAVLLGDAVRIRQVLLNLVGNAVKFTEHGQIQIHAQLLGREQGSLRLKFSVHDTGIGVPKELEERLFEPFYQLDSSSTRKYGGTGLGLAISRKLVHLMGGEIWIENSSEAGATFAFTVMVEGGEPEHEQDAPTSIIADEGEWLDRLDQMRILIAEDNPDSQKVLLKMLEKLGYKTDLAATGVEVLEHVRKQRYDLVLMDIQMPELDGLEATKEIHRTMSPQTRPQIIAVTANAFQSDKERYLATGMDGYISKPFSLEQLRDLLQRIKRPHARKVD